MRARSLTAPLNLALLLLGLTWFATPALAAGDKVTICHIPPGNPENVQIIEVSSSSAQKHVDRHGDSIFGGEEICDGVDNDCDGFVDEGFPLGQFCEDGISDCRQTGVLICDPDDATQTTCSAVALDPTEPDGEVTCEGGGDEDCDGEIDCADLDCAWDGSSSDLTCKDPVCPDGIVDAGEECDGGACCTQSCTFAGAGTVCGIDEVCRQEVCNAAHECVLENLDATCDTDPEGPNNTCDVGTDVCEAGVCVNTDPSPIAEARCDGLDNDCDPATPDSEDEICGDGVDNDCDGAVDEDCAVGCPCYTAEELSLFATTCPSLEACGVAGDSGVVACITPVGEFLAGYFPNNNPPLCGYDGALLGGELVAGFDLSADEVTACLELVVNTCETVSLRCFSSFEFPGDSEGFTSECNRRAECPTQVCESPPQDCMSCYSGVGQFCAECDEILRAEGCTNICDPPN